MRDPGDHRSPAGGRLEVWAPDGVPEVRKGDDLVGLLMTALGGADDPQSGLRDGDVVVVTSKVVSKSEGRVVPGTDRDAALPDETVRVVARRGPTTIARTRHGLTMAAAGIDASNVRAGHLVLLPLDPDASARRLRAELGRRTGVVVGVVVTDTAGRAWRDGQTDIAIGAAGMLVADDHAGRTDPHGNTLAVTSPAVADEIAGAAELASGKLGARPFTIVRGRGDLVLPADDDGPGAVALVRAEGSDLFGWGAREAVRRALRGDPDDQQPFGAPSTADELVDALDEVTGPGAVAVAADRVRVDHDDPRTSALAFAHGWVCEPAAEVIAEPDAAPDRSGGVGLRPRSP